jgi:aryl-alcohol dehydrogenase-like predicted oxidoreductase
MQGLLTGKFKSSGDVPDDRARTRHYSGDRPLARHGRPGHEAETFDAVARVAAICDDIGQPMAQVSLAWLLRQPAVTSVIAGARNRQQMESNAQAADLTLSDDVVQRLNEATDDLKTLLGPDPDMWARLGGSRYR